MDRLNVSMDVLRRLAKEADDPNCVVLAEREINDYLKPEIDALKAAIERVEGYRRGSRKRSGRRLVPNCGLRSVVS
jgi:hypothetical protein